MSASESVVAPKAKVPTRKKLRRETPSQNRVRPRGMFSMSRRPCGGKGEDSGGTSGEVGRLGAIQPLREEYSGFRPAAREKLESFFLLRQTAALSPLVRRVL